MFFYVVAIDLDKLLENGSLTSGAFDGELCRVVIMTIHVTVVFIVRVVLSKDRRTYRASKVFNVIFAIQSGNVRATQCSAAFRADKV